MDATRTLKRKHEGTKDKHTHMPGKQKQQKTSKKDGTIWTPTEMCSHYLEGEKTHTHIHAPPNSTLSLSLVLVCFLLLFVCVCVFQEKKKDLTNKILLFYCAFPTCTTFNSLSIYTQIGVVVISPNLGRHNKLVCPPRKTPIPPQIVTKATHTLHF